MARSNYIRETFSGRDPSPGLQIFVKSKRYISVLRSLALGLLASCGAVLPVDVARNEIARELVMPHSRRQRHSRTLVVSGRPPDHPYSFGRTRPIPSAGLVRVE